jgi:predicted nucleic acid-binding protein
MKVVVDTSVWSLALRRSDYNKNNPYVRELRELILEGRVQMLGPIRQELLSGIKYKEQFKKLRKILSSFPDFEVQSKDYEKAAELFNQCRKNGIQGSNTDFLICVIVINNNLGILTTDEDFSNFKKVISDLRLIEPRYKF